MGAPGHPSGQAKRLLERPPEAARPQSRGTTNGIPIREAAGEDLVKFFLRYVVARRA